MYAPPPGGVEPENAHVVKEFVAGLKVPTCVALNGANITRPSEHRVPPI
jgi:hypothetical protein